MGHIVSFLIGYFILHLIGAWFIGHLDKLEKEKQKENNGIDR
jgi:hypothetical protein